MLRDSVSSIPDQPQDLLGSARLQPRSAKSRCQQGHMPPALPGERGEPFLVARQFLVSPAALGALCLGLLGATRETPASASVFT